MRFDVINRVLLNPVLSKSLLVVFSGLFLLQFTLGFWLGDDSFISFRVVDNFLNGHGLRWNVAERVQAFTNPLWVLVVSAVVYTSGNLYWSVFFASCIAVAAGITSAIRHINRASLHAWWGVFFLILLMSSRAFMDYTSSGLENPLTYLLLCLFFAPYIFTGANEKNSSNRVAYYVFIASLAFVNRQESLLLFLAPLIHLICRDIKTRGFKGFPMIALAATPALLWSIFALLYYGFLLPNTFYGKLNIAIPRKALIENSIYYFGKTAAFDSLTMLLILIGIAGLISKKARIRWSAMSIAMHFSYAFYIGSGFMGGRFFSGIYLIACVIVVHFLTQVKAQSQLLIVALIAGCMYLFASPASPFQYRTAYKARWKLSHNETVADEKGYYHQFSNVAGYGKVTPYPDMWWARDGLSASKANVSTVYHLNIGYFGYFAGPNKHIIDGHGLAEPLLARLKGMGRRPGHYERILPDGYFESARTGGSLIRDPELRDYNRKLNLLTRGSIFSTDRLRLVLAYNFGKLRIWKKPYIIERACFKKLHSPLPAGVTFRPGMSLQEEKALGGVVLSHFAEKGKPCFERSAWQQREK